ncbi:sorbitol dehydrogenase-like [Zerene cesonia]|uniref:sorbitol dehydrogenase-like n=1 Tax=Zerene cesonia TaxID=33412 RepID=UPI0018E50265|nr:sorbitol dehydrogenase-like [Zerene cesonia]
MVENLAAVLHGPYDLRLEKYPVPSINDNEVLIKVACVGICGSDLKIYSTGRCGLEVITEPLVMGHEGAGVIVQVGANVTSLKPGDRVAIEPTQPCRSCEFCRAGRYNLCDKPQYCSTASAHGNLCTYYKHVADFCHKIPDNVSMEEAAAVQPLAIAIHACSRAGVKLGANIVIFGAGPIGVLCAMTAKAMGAAKILMTDVVESRLETARQLGVDYTLMVKDLSDQEVVDKILEIMGTNPNLSIDACGFASAQRVALMVTRTGGTVLVVGIGEEMVQVPLSGALLREVNIIGAYRLLNSYPSALAAVSSGRLDLKSFITHHYPLQKTQEAFELAKSGEAMKIIIHVDQTVV